MELAVELGQQTQQQQQRYVSPTTKGKLFWDGARMRNGGRAELGGLLSIIIKDRSKQDKTRIDKRQTRKDGTMMKVV